MIESIPLIQNVDKQNINTSLIALKRGLKQIEDLLRMNDNGDTPTGVLFRNDLVNTVTENLSEPITSGGVYNALQSLPGNSDHTPLGTWASFENGLAPSSNWLEAGSTFSANDYPELYMYLNDTTVPERFDHSKLGQIQSITLPTSSASAITMEYDGVLMLGSRTSTSVLLHINGNLVFDRKDNSYGSGATITIPFNKGDTVYNENNTPTTYFFVRYYTQHLFIKATTGADVETAVALSTSWYDALNTKVEQSQSYELNEILTGGTWIDGKPIYRKVYVNLTFGGDSNTWSNTGVQNVSIDKIIKGSAWRGDDFVNIMNFRKNSDGNIKYFTNTSYSPRCDTLILEYTKTTDNATRTIPTSENTRKGGDGEGDEIKDEKKDEEIKEEKETEEKR